MFDFLFGWRKASKCKRLLRQVQCRLVLLKNKRCSIARQLRQDVGELLKLGHAQIAFTRVEQIYKDERIIEVYDLLDHFCEFLVINLAYIRRHKDCPNDINEAISSLIFASARCGDIPELRRIRRLFGERYGQKLVMSALELLPCNLVNSQVRNNLSIKSVAEDLKIRLVNEIFRDCHIHGSSESPLALKYNSEWHQEQAKDYRADVTPNDVEGNQYSSAKDNEVLCITLPAPTMSSSPARMPVAHSPGKQDKYAGTGSSGRPKVLTLAAPLSHTSDELVQCAEENVVYLDDIQEFRSPKSKDISLLDQRVFLFKSLVFPNKHKSEDHLERSIKIGKPSNRRSKRRSLSREYWRFKENSYYGNKLDERRKQLKNNSGHFQETSNSKRASIYQKAETRLNTNSPKLGMMIPLPEPSRISSQSSHETVESEFYSCSDCASWRSISMPNERQDEVQHDRFSRHSSLPAHRSLANHHTHPKLPDFKELESTFLALKEAYLLNTKK